MTSLQLVNRGKIRDIYEADSDHLLIDTSDRLSAFDVVLPQTIPGKGEILTRISNFWFERTKHIVPNHITDIPATGDQAVIVKKLNPLPVEAIVRGYLIGSGWKDYQQNGSVCGIELPPGLQLAEKLPEAIYTPSTKAAVGDHDENINFEQTVDLLGYELANEVKEISLQIYNESAAYALDRGIIIADTKFEFGLDDDDGRLYLIDEVLTPDSSRFWAADEYEVGISPPSYDKQIIRDYLETLDWDKTPPGPELPPGVIQKTASKYKEVERILTT